MTIIKEVIRNLFSFDKPVFRIDSHRYSKLRNQEFPGLKDIADPSKLRFESFAADKFQLRNDLTNVFGDLKKAIISCKNEKRF